MKSAPDNTTRNNYTVRREKISISAFSIAILQEYFLKSFDEVLCSISMRKKFSTLFFRLSSRLAAVAAGLPVLHTTGHATNAESVLLCAFRRLCRLRHYVRSQQSNVDRASQELQSSTCFGAFEAGIVLSLFEQLYRLTQSFLPYL